MSGSVAITGINGGIGRALASAFAAEGFQIVGIDISPTGPEGVEYYQLDVTDEVKALEVYQRIHQAHPELIYWCNNAGIAKLGPFSELPLSDFHKVMAVNFTAVVVATHFWLDIFQRTGGCVINMASVAGFVPSGDMSSYVASKHAVVGFTRAIQLELDLARSSAATCLVAPGFVQTDIMQVGSQYGLPEKLQRLASSPEKCAREIVAGVLKGEREIIPTLNGKLMAGMFRLPFASTIVRTVYRKSREIKK